MSNSSNVTASVKGALTLNKVTKAFGKKVLFRDLSYSFSDNGIYSLTGESGKGKTTLLRIIAGLDKRYSGEISGGGSISFMFQEHRLFPTLSAIDNILEVSFDSCSQEDKIRTEELLSALNFAEEEFSKLPSELSGGMKQRISFARAILKNSDILLLDEPTKELDTALRQKILKIIKEESKKRLVIIVSHNEDDINELEAIKIKL